MRQSDEPICGAAIVKPLRTDEETEMGYTTKFDGILTLNKPLFDSQVLYLLEEAGTRRVKRNVALLSNVPDPARGAVGLPLGEDGGYFVNQKWDEENDWISVVDYNLPPSGQPGL